MSDRVRPVTVDRVADYPNISIFLPEVRWTGQMWQDTGDTEKLKFPDVDFITDWEKREVMATVFEISTIKQIFFSHICTFFKQKTDGTISRRSTCAGTPVAGEEIEKAIRYMENARMDIGRWTQQILKGTMGGIEGFLNSTMKTRLPWWLVAGHQLKDGWQQHYDV
jgi:hypothetical protein